MSIGESVSGELRREDDGDGWGDLSLHADSNVDEGGIMVLTDTEVKQLGGGVS